ncbi:MAG: single-stranded DNA-binding protein [Bacteroidetes bacterium]|jgi:single-strand DNA-binding protein|nr:single-stranded DNA-binding protein [Bacteroidota bacterium]
MAGVNKVILVGNLGKDPELKYLEGNIARANFSIATSEYHKDKNGNKVEQTEWHNIVVWRSMAESAEKLLKKGTQIYLEGKLQTRQWIDKDGNKRNITEVVGESFLVLQRKENTNSANPSTTDENSSNVNFDDLGKKDGLPF